MPRLREESANPLVRLAARAQRRLFYRNQWFIHLDRHGAEPLRAISGNDGFDLLPPPDRFWADPFPWTTSDGRNYVFVEELPFSTAKGHISALEFSPTGELLANTPAISQPWHLSYPFIFEWHGERWMLPEAGASRQLTLYRCADFPGRWVAEKNLLDNLRYADPTLVELDGRWWLFVTVAGPSGSIHEYLHLYYADTPLGPFEPHPANPVRRGGVGARPAGKLFHHGGELYRPAQDCSRVYGLRTVIQRIDRISVTEYGETTCGAIDPGWHPAVLRTHTLNIQGGWRAVDALRWIPRKAPFSIRDTLESPA
ncbi:MAG: hypothetical protein OHM77_02160 [Candidatus Nitricoxidivorans perseverans]|uniref:Glucosamine inositolphosphorylceramide transferase 1 N-terminal domain-containing protein n=1 Tax=Candidatus Nitricoxidivorans perseverans TaxID=2975601 RepID=A0AA49IXL2_9PROT|nr:MAG: hypothetical protein OHM77_02160 [Candidatus Nitricoxidivorans perseverans]